jgi:hypothetical protein
MPYGCHLVGLALTATVTAEHNTDGLLQGFLK